MLAQNSLNNQATNTSRLAPQLNTLNVQPSSTNNEAENSSFNSSAPPNSSNHPRFEMSLKNKTSGKKKTIIMVAVIFLLFTTVAGAFLVIKDRQDVRKGALEGVCNYPDNPDHPCHGHAPLWSTCEPNKDKGGNLTYYGKRWGCDNACNEVTLPNEWCEGADLKYCQGNGVVGTRRKNADECVKISQPSSSSGSGGKLICMPWNGNQMVNEKYNQNQIKVVNNDSKDVQVWVQTNICNKNLYDEVTNKEGYIQNSNGTIECRVHKSRHPYIIYAGDEKVFSLEVPCEKIGQLDVSRDNDHYANKEAPATDCFNTTDNNVWSGGVAFVVKDNRQEACPPESEPTPAPVLPTCGNFKISNNFHPNDNYLFKPGETFKITFDTTNAQYKDIFIRKCEDYDGFLGKCIVWGNWKKETRINDNKDQGNSTTITLPSETTASGNYEVGASVINSNCDAACSSSGLNYLNDYSGTPCDFGRLTEIEGKDCSIDDTKCSASYYIAETPALVCAHLTLSGEVDGMAHIAIKEKINLATAFSYYGQIRYGRCEGNEKCRVADTQDPQTLLLVDESGNKKELGQSPIHNSFSTETPGLYVFETNVYEDERCSKMCSAAGILYKNNGSNCSSTSWTNIGQCVAHGCIKYLEVRGIEAPCKCVTITLLDSQKQGINPDKIKAGDIVYFAVSYTGTCGTNPTAKIRISKVHSGGETVLTRWTAEGLEIDKGNNRFLYKYEIPQNVYKFKIDAGVSFGT